jgi:hypothetical protein
MQRLNKNNTVVVVDSRHTVSATGPTAVPVPVPVPAAAAAAAAAETTPAPVTATDITAAVKLTTAAIPDVNPNIKILAAAAANDVNPNIKKISFAPTNKVNNKRRKIQEYVLHDNSSLPVKNTHDQHEKERQQQPQARPKEENDFYYGRQHEEHPYMSLYAPVQLFDGSSSAFVGGEGGGGKEYNDDTDTVIKTNTDMAEIAEGNETMTISNNNDDKDYEEREQRFRAILNGEEINIDDIEAEDHGVYHIVGEDGEFETVVESYNTYHHPQDSTSVEENDGSKSYRPTTPPLPSTIAYAGEAVAGVIDLYHHNYPAQLQQHQHQLELENAYYGEGNNNGNDADAMMTSPLTKALLACRNKVALPTTLTTLKSTKAKIHKAATTKKIKSSLKSREEKLYVRFDAGMVVVLFCFYHQCVF